MTRHRVGFGESTAVFIETNKDNLKNIRNNNIFFQKPVLMNKNNKKKSIFLQPYHHQIFDCRLYVRREQKWKSVSLNLQSIYPNTIKKGNQKEKDKLIFLTVSIN